MESWRKVRRLSNEENEGMNAKEREGECNGQVWKEEGEGNGEERGEKRESDQWGRKVHMDSVQPKVKKEKPFLPNATSLLLC